MTTADISEQIGIKQVTFKIRGIRPMLTHNGQTADPLNPFAVQMKEITSKRTKTDDDHQRLRDIEWRAGLYLNANDHPVITADCMLATLLAAAKKFKCGEKCKAGVDMFEDAEMEIPGGWDLEKAARDPRFRLVKPMVVNRARVIRCRPRFDNWSATITLSFMPDVVNKKDIIRWMETAGRLIGINESRPRYGRFVVESVE